MNRKAVEAYTDVMVLRRKVECLERNLQREDTSLQKCTLLLCREMGDG